MPHLPDHARPWMSPSNAQEAAREAAALTRILEGFRPNHLAAMQAGMAPNQMAAVNVPRDSLPSGSQYLQGRASERLAVLAGLMGFALTPVEEEAEAEERLPAHTAQRVR